MYDSQQITASRPIYDINKSYADNVLCGPVFEGPLPHREALPEDQWIDFLGYRLSSPLGVPAGPLLTCDWIELASALGFDILTYKTIRSQAYGGHPLPNVIFIESDPADPRLMRQRSDPPEDLAKVSITNSFGMPSMSPEFLQEDLGRAKKALRKGQILIVSVTGAVGAPAEMANDFVRAALLAKEGGADVIEANFSCPNIGTKGGFLYCDPEASFLIARKLERAVHPLPVMIKVGKFPHFDLMREAFIAYERANVRGVCGINTIPARVLNGHDKPALDEGREVSGICGEMIRAPALSFICDARRIIRQEQLSLGLAGCGGIMLPEHFDAFLAAGADVALTATGMMWDPYLASKWHQRKRA